MNTVREDTAVVAGLLGVLAGVAFVINFLQVMAIIIDLMKIM